MGVGNRSCHGGDTAIPSSQSVVTSWRLVVQTYKLARKHHVCGCGYLPSSLVHICNLSGQGATFRTRATSAIRQHIRPRRESPEEIGHTWHSKQASKANRLDGVMVGLAENNDEATNCDMDILCEDSAG